MVEAGAFSNLDWNESDRTITKFKKKIKVFYQTAPIPRALELVRKNLSPDIKSRLKEILLNAHKDPKAKAALKAYKKTKRFDKIGSGILESINLVRRLARIVQKELIWL